jgi:cytochrome c55X
MAWGALALAAFGLLPAAATVADPAPPPARQSQLIYLLKQDCGSCHGLTLKGGLAPPLLPDAIAERDDETLIEAILDGRPGTPMPPWRFEIAPREAAWLVKQLRRGVDEP